MTDAGIEPGIYWEKEIFGLISAVYIIFLCFH